MWWPHPLSPGQTAFHLWSYVECVSSTFYLYFLLPIFHMFLPPSPMSIFHSIHSLLFAGITGEPFTYIYTAFVALLWNFFKCTQSVCTRNQTDIAQ